MVARTGLAGRAATALRLPGLVGAAHRGFRDLVRQGGPGRRGLPLGARCAAVERRAGRQTPALPAGIAAVLRWAGDASPSRPRRRDTRRSAARLFRPARPGQRHRHPDRRAAPHPRGAAAARYLCRAAGRLGILCRAGSKAAPPATGASSFRARAAAGRGARRDARMRHRRGAVALARNRAACRARSLRRGDAGAWSAAWRHRGTRHGRERRDPRASREAGGLGRVRSSILRIARPRSRDCEKAFARRAQSTRSRARWRKFTARSGCDDRGRGRAEPRKTPACPVRAGGGSRGLPADHPCGEPDGGSGVACIRAVGADCRLGSRISAPSGDRPSPDRDPAVACHDEGGLRRLCRRRGAARRRLAPRSRLCLGPARRRTGVAGSPVGRCAARLPRT